MPLPDLKPNSTTDKQKHHAAYFDALYLADPERLGPRIACLEPLGVNLLLQRWVHHNSRVRASRRPPAGRRVRTCSSTRSFGQQCAPLRASTCGPAADRAHPLRHAR